jgi:hypothetical protein
LPHAVWSIDHEWRCAGQIDADDLTIPRTGKLALTLADAEHNRTLGVER